MIAKSKSSDEIRVTIQGCEPLYVYVDYTEDRPYVTWPASPSRDKWMIAMTMLMALKELLPPQYAVKMLTALMFTTQQLEIANGDPPIKEEPPF